MEVIAGRNKGQCIPHIFIFQIGKTPPGMSWTFQVFLNTENLGLFAMLYLLVLRMDDKVGIPSAISTNSEYSNLRQSFDEYLAGDFLYPSSVLGLNKEFVTSSSRTSNAT